MPGVGSFTDAMTNLCDRGWIPGIKRAALEEGLPFLGICLGMQLLAEQGLEGGSTEGLGLIPGTIRRLAPKEPGTRIPHVGWNEVRQQSPHPLFAGIPDGTDFYFVHSYHFEPTESTDMVTTTPYCDQFVSTVARGRVYGVQFHPEKSSKLGLRLLKNFLMI